MFEIIIDINLIKKINFLKKLGEKMLNNRMSSLINEFIIAKFSK